MSAPLVVSTRDGAVWTRRAVLADGTALYALAEVCQCPEFVMATLPKLAEHGVTWSGDVLPEPQDIYDRLIGTNLSLYEEERETARLRLALKSAQRGRRELRARVAELEAERHDTNESLSEAAEALRRQRDRIEEMGKREAVVAEFVAKRAEVIVAIENCHPDNAHDYNRWQGHAESRRQLAQALGLPVAWPSPAEAGDGS